MMTQHPFPVEEATVKHLEEVKETWGRHVWEHYHNPDFDPEEAQWPHTIECFREWHARHVGIAKLLRLTLPQVRPSQNTTPVDILLAVSEALEHAFNDFGDLLTWAIECWEQDPSIRPPKRDESAGQNVIPLHTT